mgnify:FL=1|jgi:hypothetical protein
MARPRGLLAAFGPSSQGPTFFPFAGSLQVEPIRGCSYRPDTHPSGYAQICS